jgi:hypothetical protein
MSSPTLDARRIRAAQTQSFFREVNRRIAELAQKWDTSTLFVCECLDVACAEQLRITESEYARVRADPTSFFVLDGHYEAEIEEVLEHNDRYLVVRKLGAGALAATLFEEVALARAG